MEWLLGMTSSHMEDVTISVPFMGSTVIREDHRKHEEAASGG